MTTELRRTEYMPLEEIRAAKRNAKQHAQSDIVGSIQKYDFGESLMMDERTGRLVAGHGRLEALAWMRDANHPPPPGIDTEGPTWLVPVTRGWASRDDAHAHAAGIAFNKLTEKGGWDSAELASMLDEIRTADPSLLDAVGFEPSELDEMMRDLATGSGDGDEQDEDSDTDTEDNAARTGPSLADRFLIPPFDVLDARQGWWRDRKRAWLDFGIHSETGRSGWTYDDDGNIADAGSGLIFDNISGGDPSFYDKKNATEKRLGYTMTTAEFQASEHYEPPANSGVGSGTSVFDPVLCELTYRWFSPDGGLVLDPFAGGSVRGLVAALLGRRYLGNDLSADQITANQHQADDMAHRGLIDRDTVSWSSGDSATWVPTLDPNSADLLFSCPPYLWLEQYDKDDPADISNMDTAGFENAYTSILTGAVRALRDDRFAVLVVGDVRDNKGRLHDLRGMTIRAAEKSGLTFHNGAVLVTSAGSLAMRAGRAFEGTRVLGRHHQDVLVFYKGDRKRAATACGDVSTHMPDNPDDAFNETGPALDGGDYIPERTPIEEHAGVWVKRDDAWNYRGASGAKARAMIEAAQAMQAEGIVSAGARQSPQLERAALAAQALGIECRLHTGTGRDSDETRVAEDAGSELVRHKPARLSVIKARYRADVESGQYDTWLQVPFGMEHPLYLEQIAEQAEALPVGSYERIVVPTGSGMTLAGVLTGLDRAANLTPVVAVLVGSDPSDRLDTYAPGWRDRVTVIESDLSYETRAANRLGDLRVDPVYEAKALPHLRPNDLLWCVGVRASIRDN